MKIPAHKGKFALLVIYVIVVFVAPFYTAISYDPVKISGMITKFVPEKDDQFFRNYIGLLSEQKVDEAYSLLSSEAQQVVTKNALGDLASKEFSTLSTSDMIVVGATVTYIEDQLPRTVYRMSYEAINNNPEKKYVVVNIGARDLGQGIKIDATETVYRNESLKDGKFSFPKPDWTMILAILAPLFVAYTAYRYLAKATKLSWWVLLMILLGSLYFTIHVDGGFNANLGLNGFFGPAGLWGPWVYNPFLPLGAIIYYFFCKKWEGSVYSASSSTEAN